MAEIAVLREFKVEPNPSLGYNNLTCGADGTMAFFHNEDVVVVRTVGAARLNQPEAVKATVTSVQFVTARGRPLLCLTNRFQTAVYDVARDVPIIKIPTDGTADPRCCGVVEVDGQSTLVVGATSGTLFFYDMSADFEVGAPVKTAQHTASISAIATLRPEAMATGTAPSVCTGDTDGRLCVWSAKGALISTATFEGECVTGVTFVGTAVIAVSFGSGTVRILDVASCAPQVALGAHSRWINALAYSHHTNRLVTVGDDNLMCLWSLPTASNPSVALVGHRIMPNSLLTGAAFTPDGSSLTIAAYDTDALWTFNVAGI